MFRLVCLWQAMDETQVRRNDYATISAALSALLVPAVFLNRARLPILVLGGGSIGLGVGATAFVVERLTKGQDKEFAYTTLHLRVQFASRKYSNGQLRQLAHTKWKCVFVFVFSDKARNRLLFIATLFIPPQNEVSIWIVGIVRAELWAIEG